MMMIEYEIPDGIAWDYVRKIKAGEIKVCFYIIAAINRDLKRYHDPDSQEYFDPEPGIRFRNFCRNFFILKGPLGGNPFELAEWQIWVVSMLLGWKNKSGPYKGKRYYKQAYIEVPRGNGKTAFMAMFALFMLTRDNEWAPEIYCAATSQSQADLLMETALANLRYPKAAEFVRWLKVFRYRNFIQCRGEKEGYFKALSSDSDTFDGKNIHVAIVDELHAHKTSKTWDVLKSGALKRDQSLMIAITTAGTNLNGFGASMSELAKKTLKGELSHDSNMFCSIWTIDNDDDPYKEESWIKANPSWNLGTINKQDFKNDIMRAKDFPEWRPEAFTKLLNVWCSDSSTWLEDSKVHAAFDNTLDEASFTEDPCIVGCDLSYTEDQTAIVNVYSRMLDGKYHYYIFPRYYTPARQIQIGADPKFPRWNEMGLLNISGQDIIDYDDIEADLMHQKDSGLNIIEYALDPWNAKHIIQHLMKKYGDDMVCEVSQSGSSLNEPSKYFKALLYEGRIHFNNEMFTWNCLNAKAKINEQGNVHITKDNKYEKIDGLKAAINALAEFLIRDGDFNEQWTGWF